MAKELEEAFKMFDDIGDRKISEEGLRIVLLSLGEIDETELKTEFDQYISMIQDLNANGDGEIDLLESSTSDFKIPLYSSSKTGGDDERVRRDATLRSVFDVFDSDKDGFISTEELHRVLQLSPDLDDDHTARGTTSMRAKGGEFLWWSILLAAGFLSYLPLVEGSSEGSSPGSSDHSTSYYLSIYATIISPVIAVITLAATIYYRRRKRGETSMNPAV